LNLAEPVFSGTQEILNKTIEDLKTKKKISIIQNPNELLIWQYEGKPLIGMNKTNGKIYTTQETINHYGIEYCQKQAAYILQILRKYDLAHFTQYIVKLDFYRLGKTPEELKQTFDALIRLSKMKKPNTKTHEQPSVVGVQMHEKGNRQSNLYRATHKEESTTYQTHTDSTAYHILEEKEED
jgi:hypothetical protein